MGLLMSGRHGCSFHGHELSDYDLRGLTPGKAAGDKQSMEGVCYAREGMQGRNQHRHRGIYARADRPPG